ncbi:MAG: Holliday junction resolvase Hjc [Candidatus Micrarchaeia archaeon]
MAAFGSYKKGSRAENELIKKLIEVGFSAIRAAGSGGGASPCPDILAFRNVDQYGFECKAIDSPNLQLRKEQVNELKIWQANTNITTYIAWRIRGGEWLFVRTDYLKENPKSFSISFENAKKYSQSLESILKKQDAPPL